MALAILFLKKIPCKLRQQQFFYIDHSGDVIFVFLHDGEAGVLRFFDKLLRFFKLSSRDKTVISLRGTIISFAVRSSNLKILFTYFNSFWLISRFDSFQIKAFAVLPPNRPIRVHRSASGRTDL